MFFHRPRSISAVPLQICRRHNQAPTQIFSLITLWTPSVLFSTTPNHSSSSSLPLLLLPLCSSAQSLQQTKQAHAVALLHGFLPHSVSVCASLILRYATFGDPSSSHTLFAHSAPFSRSAFLWNTLIRAFSISGVNDDFEIYNTMLWNGVNPDQHTLPFVLKVCTDYFEVRKGKEVHGLAFKVGFDSDLFVGNTLTLFYGGIGDLRGAEKVFDEMVERDIVSWNTIIVVRSVNGHYIEAINSFRKVILRSGLMPNAVSIVSVLPVCAALGDEFMAREVHCYVVKVGLCGQMTIGNALVDAYGKCGNLMGMKQVFGEMGEKSEVSWNAMISSFAYTHNFKDALDTFRQMIDVGQRPNSVTVSSMIPALVDIDCFLAGKELHGFSLRLGMISDIFVANSLIDMYAKFGYSNEASIIFHNMNTWNAVSWNSMIANFAQNDLELAAVGLVRQMQAHGAVPNSVTFTNVLPACARIGLLCVGKEIHAHSIRTGAAFDVFVSNALIDMYAKCRFLNLAQNVFDISLRDEISYTTLIMGYSQTSDCSKSLNLFLEMRQMRMIHDTVSFVGVLSACANQGTIKQGKEIHGFLVRHLFHTNLFIANSLVDLYSKCGQIEVARNIFNRISVKDVASWNTMILGYGMLGKTDIAITLFEHMRKYGFLQYDSISFIAILAACSHGGLVDEGRRYFCEMDVHNIKPTQTHYACMVDLLGRAGLIEEAADLISGMKITPDSNIWGAMLGACRIYGNVQKGCWAAEHLLKLNSGHSGYYVLLSNMYAEAGRWSDAHRVRELMKSREVMKTPGRSWV